MPNLPIELVRVIVQFLPAHDALALAATCSVYHEDLTDFIHTRHILYGLHGDKALWWACRQDNDNSPVALAVAERALRAGADPNAHVYVPGGDRSSTLTCNTPLRTAISNQHAALVELLLQYGADPSGADGVHTPKSSAVDSGL